MCRKKKAPAGRSRREQGSLHHQFRLFAAKVNHLQQSCKQTRNYLQKTASSQPKAQPPPHQGLKGRPAVILTEPLQSPTAQPGCPTPPLHPTSPHKTRTVSDVPHRARQPRTEAQGRTRFGNNAAASASAHSSPSPPAKPRHDPQRPPGTATDGWVLSASTPPHQAARIT